LIEPISYLEAVKSLKPINLENLSKKKISLLSSSSLIQLDIFIRGIFSKVGFDLSLQTLDFGTLKQFLLSGNNTFSSDQTIFLLFPWDFVESLNWRTGYLCEKKCIQEYQNEIDYFVKLLSNKSLFRDPIFIYVDCPVPNILRKASENKILLEIIKIAAINLSAKFVSSSFFSLSNFIFTGLPIQNKKIGDFAWLICKFLIDKNISKKIIIIDLDNSLWDGVLGEDGLEGIKADQHEKGYFFFILQTFLKSLKNNGVLLAAVSKNDLDFIKEAFNFNDFPLKENDFIKLIGTYQPKSLQIKNLLKQINLTPDSCIFIDDNEIEIEEVRKNVRDVTCYKLENNLEYLPTFLEKIRKNFYFSDITNEDIDRTNLYQRKLDDFAIESGNSNNINNYLKSLKIKLYIQKANISNLSRAYQLLNKTNQFNLNGIRRTNNELIEMMQEGCKIFTGTIKDKNGSLGEVLVLIIDKNSKILSFVMSCRVFQRRAEYAFLAFLRDYGFSEITFDFIKTKRNQPFYQFALDVAEEYEKNRFLLKEKNFNNLLKNFQEIIEIKKI
tara:strand:- start:1121 stop:2782 length:1662 start_codon:yes stop_codon:yes gene_type:complete